MSFVVTARKWRPKKFSEVVGQEHITATLKNAIKNGRIAHAYLFTGPRGVGKTTTARILAKTLNCTNQKDFEPCNECEMCLSISNNQSMDIIEIDGASNRGIDEIRTLRESVKYAPTNGKFKIYIIDEVHMLTKESFNAFLKTLEEPPAHTIFIFATTDVHKVPLTIISRCQRFDFRRIQLDVIKKTLASIAGNENIKIDDKTLTIIAKKADGALRDAQSLFDQVVSFCGDDINSATVAQMLNLIDDDIYFSVSDAVINKDFKQVFEITKTIYENGWSFIDFMDGLIEHFRNIMTASLSGNTDLIETAEVLRPRFLKYTDSFSEGDLLRILNFLSRIQQELRYSQNHKLKIEIALSHLVGLERTETLSNVISMIGNNSSPLPQKKSEQKSTDFSPVKKNIKETIVQDTEQKDVPKKEKISKPEKNYTRVDPNFNFETIVDKWESFANAIINERRFTFGDFFGRIQLVNLEGNRLKLKLSDSDGRKAFDIHQDYIEKKSMDFFGKKISFNFTADFSNDPEFDIDAGLEKPEKKLMPQDENDPIVNAIINELGGEEIG